MNDVLSIAQTLRYHFSDEEHEEQFDRIIAIMYCNLGSIALQQFKYREAFYCANQALQLDSECLQSHRIRAEYYLRYKSDHNSGMNEILEILAKDEDHPYAVNAKKEIDDEYAISTQSSSGKGDNHYGRPTWKCKSIHGDNAYYMQKVRPSKYVENPPTKCVNQSVHSNPIKSEYAEKSVPNNGRDGRDAGKAGNTSNHSNSGKTAKHNKVSGKRMGSSTSSKATKSDKVSKSTKSTKSQIEIIDKIRTIKPKEQKQGNQVNRKVPCPRERHSAVSYRNDRLIIYGGSKYNIFETDPAAEATVYLMESLRSSGRNGAIKCSESADGSNAKEGSSTMKSIQNSNGKSNGKSDLKSNGKSTWNAIGSRSTTKSTAKSTTKCITNSQRKTINIYGTEQLSSEEGSIEEDEDKMLEKMDHSPSQCQGKCGGRCAKDVERLKHLLGNKEENNMETLKRIIRNEALNDLWILDIHNNRWTQLDAVGAQPSPRHSHTASIIEHKLYIIGGARTNELYRPFILNESPKKKRGSAVSTPMKIRKIHRDEKVSAQDIYAQKLRMELMQGIPGKTVEVSEEWKRSAAKLVLFGHMNDMSDQHESDCSDFVEFEGMDRGKAGSNLLPSNPTGSHPTGSKEDINSDYYHYSRNRDDRQQRLESHKELKTRKARTTRKPREPNHQFESGTTTSGERVYSLQSVSTGSSKFRLKTSVTFKRDTNRQSLREIEQKLKSLSTVSTVSMEDVDDLNLDDLSSLKPLPPTDVTDRSDRSEVIDDEEGNEIHNVNEGNHTDNPSNPNGSNGTNGSNDTASPWTEIKDRKVTEEVLRSTGLSGWFTNFFSNPTKAKQTEIYPEKSVEQKSIERREREQNIKRAKRAKITRNMVNTVNAPRTIQDILVLPELDEKLKSARQSREEYMERMQQIKDLATDGIIEERRDTIQTAYYDADVDDEEGFSKVQPQSEVYEDTELWREFESSRDEHSDGHSRDSSSLYDDGHDLYSESCCDDDTETQSGADSVRESDSDLYDERHSRRNRNRNRHESNGTESKSEELLFPEYNAVFPAVEMLDLKANKWTRPETTGTPPTSIMVNHRSIVVGKKIFVFPVDESFPYEFDGDRMCIGDQIHNLKRHEETKERLQRLKMAKISEISKAATTAIETGAGTVRSGLKRKRKSGDRDIGGDAYPRCRCPCSLCNLSAKEEEVLTNAMQRRTEEMIQKHDANEGGSDRHRDLEEALDTIIDSESDLFGDFERKQDANRDLKRCLKQRRRRRQFQHKLALRQWLNSHGNDDSEFVASLCHCHYRPMLKEVMTGYVLHTDTMHWETFNIPRSHRMILKRSVIPVLMERESDRISFVTPFGAQQHSHCLLLTRNMEWTPIRQIPSGPLSGYDRLMHFAYTAHDGLVAVHGGILRRDLYFNLDDPRQSTQELHPPNTSMLGCFPIDDGTNRIDRTAPISESTDDESADSVVSLRRAAADVVSSYLYDERSANEVADSEDISDDTASTEAISEKFENFDDIFCRNSFVRLHEGGGEGDWDDLAHCKLESLWQMNLGKTPDRNGYGNRLADALSNKIPIRTDSHVSFVEALLLNRNPLSLHRIGPISQHPSWRHVDDDNDDEALSESASLDSGSVNVHKLENTGRRLASGAPQGPSRFTVSLGPATKRLFGDDSDEDDSDDEKEVTSRHVVRTTDNRNGGILTTRTTSTVQLSSNCKTVRTRCITTYSKSKTAEIGDRHCAVTADIPKLKRCTNYEFGGDEGSWSGDETANGDAVKMDRRDRVQAVLAPPSLLEKSGNENGGERVCPRGRSLKVAAQQKCRRTKDKAVSERALLSWLPGHRDDDVDDDLELSLCRRHLYDLRSCDLNNIRFADYDPLFLSHLELFDAVSMRWYPRSSMEMAEGDGILDANHRVEADSLWRTSGIGAVDMLRSPRINHSLTVVGADLCIFGGIDSSDVLIVTDFIKTADALNESLNASRGRSDEGGYQETNALSLSKRLFGTSPTEYAQTTYTSMVQCANCHCLESNRFNFRTCSGCAQVQYCSKLCQQRHWKATHTHFCSKKHLRAS